MTTGAKKSTAWVVLVVILSVPASIALAYLSHWITTWFPDWISSARADEVAPQLFSSSPFATSREEAMKNRLGAFLVLDPPLDLSATIVTRMLRATEKPGKKVKITAGEHFWAMVWGNNFVRYNYPLGVIPDGSLIPAESWEIPVPLAGETIYVFLVSLTDQQFFNWGFAVVQTAFACSPILDKRIPINVARAT